MAMAKLVFSAVTEGSTVTSDMHAASALSAGATDGSHRLSREE